MCRECAEIQEIAKATWDRTFRAGGLSQPHFFSAVETAEELMRLESEGSSDLEPFDDERVKDANWGKAASAGIPKTSS